MPSALSPVGLVAGAAVLACALAACSGSDQHGQGDDESVTLVSLQVLGLEGDESVAGRTAAVDGCAVLQDPAAPETVRLMVLPAGATVTEDGESRTIDLPTTTLTIGDPLGDARGVTVGVSDLIEHLEARSEDVPQALTECRDVSDQAVVVHLLDGVFVDLSYDHA